MRTTIDLPNSLRKTLAQSSTSDAEGLTEAEHHRQRMEAFFKAIDENRVQTGPVGAFDREELYDRHD